MMLRRLRVLIIEDNEADAALIMRELQRSGYEPVARQVESAGAMQQALQQESWDVVLADWNLPQFSALSALDLMKSRDLDLPFIIVSGTIGEEAATSAIKAGAYDFVSKENLKRLALTIEKGQQEADHRRARRNAETALRESEERYRTLVELSPSGVFVLSKGRTVYVNPTGVALLGAKNAQEILDRSPFELIHPDYHHIVHESMARILSGGEVVHSAERIYLKMDGTPIPVQLEAARVTWNGQSALLGLFSDITARKQMEAELLEREERLRLFIEHSPVALAMFDREMRYVAVSRRWQSDYDDESVIGRSLYEVFPEISERWRAIHRRCLAGAVERGEEDSFVRADGRTNWVRWGIRPWLTAAGSVGGIVIFSEDITERKEAERILEQSTRRYKDLVNSIQGVVWEADAATAQFTFVSPQVEAMLGYSIEQWLSSPTFWVDHMYPEDRSWAPQYCHEETLKHRGHTFEYRMLAADGRTVWVRDIVSVLVEDGRATKLRGILEDITAHKQAEETMRRLGAIVESSEDAIISKTLNSVVTSWNYGAARLFGYQMEEMIGQPITKLFPPDRLDEEVQILEQLKRGKAIQQFETVRRAKDGQLRHVSLTISLMRDKHGAITEISTIARDISEQKRAEGQLLELNARLATISSHLELVREEEQKRLAHDLHDELGHQLTAIKLDVSFLEQLTASRNESDRQTLAETMGRLRRALDGAITSVRKIARQARPGSLDQLGLAATLEALVGDVRDHAGIQARFTSVVDEETFAPSKALEVALYRVAQEALTNVVRHSGATSVEVRLREEDGRILLEIQDNGKGFEESRYAPDQSFGLRGMKERLEMVGGQFSIIGCQGGGTVVTAMANLSVEGPCQLS